METILKESKGRRRRKLFYANFLLLLSNSAVVFENATNQLIESCPPQYNSTERAIMEITDNLKASIECNLISCGLFLDFSKAFDTVNHQILLDKGTVVRVPNQVMFKSSLILRNKKWNDIIISTLTPHSSVYNYK